MEITEHQQQLIDENGGKLTPELAAQLIDQELHGDTAPKPAEEGSQPVTTQEQEQADTPKAEAQTQQQPDESQMNAENAVLMAKDGKHTIPYERLADARRGEQEWKQKFEDSQSQLAQLQANAQQRIDNGQASTTQDNQVAIAQQAIEQGVDPAVFGDFSEKDLAAGIQKVVDMRVSAMVDQRVKDALAPFQQQQAISAEQAHFTEIFTAHPDAESVVESKEFNDWMNAQPSITKGAYETVLNGGSASQVVELLGLYKSANQSTEQAVEPDKVKAAAQEAVKNAQTQVPHSLSDLPAGSPAGVSRDERIANMTPAQMIEEMSDWTEEQREQYLNRRV
ncbi:hypothetical protein [Acinetobacter wuhouensis]|uniref:Uncharacterized protein n=1 Tax=Acinetobacter wuhouensis TaxID=1879050 RepID=A0A3G2T2C3_9GAMM|nr:hypothetical protein [Acinetobacter wuhouensis]AYO54400.1 hypothetical protein CDG68_12465 [Acinetobacter wuhouensis]